MNKFPINLPTAALFLCTLIISSCGGSDSGGSGGSQGITYNGNTSPAAIDASNTEAIGNAAGESVQIANSSTELPGAITTTPAIDINQINEIIITTSNFINLPAGLDVPGVCDTGSASVPDTTVPPASGPFNITITYNNCAVTGTDITVNGTASIHYDDFAAFLDTGITGVSINYSNFSVTDPINGTTTINLTFSCTNFSDLNTCTYSSDFIGNDGITHRVTDFNITGNSNTGFNGTATFFHGTHGEVSITITNITYGMCTPYPDGGSISYSSSDGSSGTIIFAANCTVSGTWHDGMNAGAF